MIEPQARFFFKNRGLALFVRKGNPLRIGGLTHVVRGRRRIALPDSGDVRAKCRAAADESLGKPGADALFAAECGLPGRLGIMPQDSPEMVARGFADVGSTWYHSASYWAPIFANHFELVAISGGSDFLCRHKVLLGRSGKPDLALIR